VSIPTTPTTALSRHAVDAIAYRDRDLTSELLGTRSFVEVFFYQAIGRDPAPGERAVVEAILIALMEHGFTPSVIAARMVYSSSPENLQAGVAAGLLAVGTQFVGTMEGCAELLARLVVADDPDAAAAALAREHRERRQPVPGFGHHLHRPDDPRVVRLFELADEAGVTGAHRQALMLLAGQVDEHAGRHVTINTTGAVAALLGDMGVPIRLMRGFAVVARAAGLVAHIGEEQQAPTGRFIWDLVDNAIPFVDGRS
jgi:citrate synthase